jgi:DNA repair protein RecO (recombination protein O)
MDKAVSGLVLKAIDYKENDKLLTILTLDMGKILVVARGVKKSTSKLKSYSQSFCFGEFELQQGKSGWVLVGVNPIDTFFELLSDFEKYKEACTVIEICDKICVENQSYPKLLLEALKTIKQINYSQISPKLLLSKFMMNVLNFEGFYVSATHCSNCRSSFMNEVYFDASTGELLCHACKNNNCEQLDGGVFSTLKILSSTDGNKLVTVRLPNAVVERTFTFLSRNLCNKFEIHLNSAKL